MHDTRAQGHPRYERLAQRAAAVFAIVVVAGNVSFPLALAEGEALPNL